MTTTLTRELERRFLIQPLELRAAAGGGPGHLVGYAAKFNTYSQNLGGFVETIEPGAFDKSLADSVRVMCRYNHDDAALLGTTEADTLQLRVDETGLFYDVDLPDTMWGRDCAALAARGDLRYSSFAFYCIEDEWDFTEQGFPLRRVLAAQLVDVAPVNSPAYLDTSVAKRSLAERIHVPMPELEKKSAPEVRDLLKRAMSDADDNPGRLAQAVDAALDQMQVLLQGVDAEALPAEVQQALGLLTAADNAVDKLLMVLGVSDPDGDEQHNSDHGTPEARQASPEHPDTEQRDTHSAPVAVERLRLELDQLR